MPTARLNGINIYYEVAGSGPPIVLIHGFADSAAIWRSQIELLAARHRVVAWDLRGHWRTESPQSPEAYTMQAICDDLRSLLDHLEISQAVLVGHSMGGYVSLRFYDGHPERVRAMVLVATGPGYPNPQHRQEWADSQVKLAERLAQRGLDTVFTPQTNGIGTTTAGERPQHLVRGIAYTARGVNTDAPPAKLEKVAVPAFVIVGEHDSFVNATGYMAAKITGARKLVIEGAGHFCHTERPEVFNKALLEFLDSLQDGSRNK